MWNRIQEHLFIVPVLLVGTLTGREHLLRIIRREDRNAFVFDLLSQLFQGCRGPVTAMFRKLAAEESRHAAILKWCYRRRFGSEGLATQPATVESKTLERALHAGLHRLSKQKPAKKRLALASIGNPQRS